MSKRSDGPQLDLDFSGTPRRTESCSQNQSGSVAQFVDAATLQIRRDAARRVAANGIFSVPTNFRRG
ncbi:hypothetical protein [Novosphingobium sp. MD-1]|uniref:hypothetical protein n=1 Tax=Novosphingobium sp. MD-1 TaxID=1630648 RepID=UPI000F7E8B2C|nr:hypothetical protein [Novosphingobium sp. MD-1]